MVMCLWPWTLAVGPSLVGRHDADVDRDCLEDIAGFVANISEEWCWQLRGRLYRLVFEVATLQRMYRTPFHAPIHLPIRCRRAIGVINIRCRVLLYADVLSRALQVLWDCWRTQRLNSSQNGNKNQWTWGLSGFWCLSGFWAGVWVCGWGDWWIMSSRLHSTTVPA